MIDLLAILCYNQSKGVAMKLLFYQLLILLAIISYINESIAEDRIKIGMVDSGISKEQTQNPILCQNGFKSIIPRDFGYDGNGHGTNIFGLLSQDLDSNKYCIISYKVWNKNVTGKKTISYIVQAIEKAIKDDVRFLNISMSGYGYNLKEFKALQKASKFMKIAVSAGNDSIELNNKYCNTYPACYNIPNNFYVIGGYDTEVSNFGSKIDFFTFGKNLGSPVLTGTSQATAFFTNKFILKKEKNMVYRNRRLDVRQKIFRTPRSE